MKNLLNDLEVKLSNAVKSFWQVRSESAQSVRGGKHLDSFRNLVASLLLEAGVDEHCIYWKTQTELPGWFRAEKSWDLLIVINNRLIAVIEFKSQVGSFGNNFNNRTEEALGSATDLWSAYEKGAFYPSARPWLGYFMLLEDTEIAKQPIRVKEPHFQVFSNFRNASYTARYQQLLVKLVRSRLYDAACLLTSPQEEKQAGLYNEPDLELTFRAFMTSLIGRVIAALGDQK
jgi:hypothetical protein